MYNPKIYMNICHYICMHSKIIGTYITHARTLQLSTDVFLKLVTTVHKSGGIAVDISMTTVEIPLPA